ncbi:MAG: family 10 glycosylhydrolase [Cyanobacteria bacterium P01_H01_bin.15]
MAYLGFKGSLGRWIAGLLACIGLGIPIEVRAVGNFCQLSEAEISRQDQLLTKTLTGDAAARQQYQALVQQNARQLQQCRAGHWLQTQAVWLRLYPCDTQPGQIERVLDRIVAQGYNEIYLEVFYNSQVLLPASQNQTPWESVALQPRNADLLADTIKKGRERGLKVYAWLSSLNFGYNYAQRPDRQKTLARNAKGQNSLEIVHDQSQAFVDPYSSQAQTDYRQLLTAVLQRQPDGILFDYIRYPRGTGAHSVVSRVQDLWIYSDASRQALAGRAQNQQGRYLIAEYLEQGYLTVDHLKHAQARFPKESVPRWQGRTPDSNELKWASIKRRDHYQQELWILSVAHAAQGVIDFLHQMAGMAKQRGIPAGAVFFPDGNRTVGQNGFDSRLQAWNRFSTALEWHAMAYGVCGDPSCITELVSPVAQTAPDQTRVVPAITGHWGQRFKDRPTLEAQMADIRAKHPNIRAMSHFSFGWQHPTFDRERQACEI